MLHPTPPPARRRSAALCLALLAACGSSGSSGGGPAPAQDTVAPTLAFTAPAGGAVLVDTVRLELDVADDTGVVRVAFTLDGAPLGSELTAPPWALDWDTRQVADGPHQLRASARDAAGNQTLSDPIAVQVANGAPPDLDPPVVGFLDPPTTGVVSGTVALAVEADDPSGVESVQFLLDGKALGPLLLEAPYTLDWDARSAAEGAHTLGVRARDGARNEATLELAVTVGHGDAPPAVRFATFFGRGGRDTARDVFVDETGYVVVAGGTNSAGFPTTAGAADDSFNGVHDAWVAKFAPDGQLVFATLLGGPNYDRAYAVEMDEAGFVYVGGRAGDGYPTTTGALQVGFGGDVIGSATYGEQDGFVTKLSPDGKRIVWSTFFGGDDKGVLRDIAVAPDGSVYLGYTKAERPVPHVTPGAFQAELRGPSDVFVARLAPDGSQLEFGTYLGGSGADGGTPSVRVAPDGGVFVLTHTESDDLPVTPGAYQPVRGGDLDLFVARLSPDGRSLVACTYFGGSATDFTETHGLAVTAQGEPVLAGTTRSVDLPYDATGLPPAFQASFAGPLQAPTGAGSNYGGDGFVARLAADLSELRAFTYLGGSRGEGIEGVGVDARGYVSVSGATSSDSFPTTANAVQPAKGGAAEAFLARLDPDLSQLLFSTYYGGSQNDLARSLSVSPGGSILCTGMTSSADFPTSKGAQDPDYAGEIDGMLLRVDP